MKSLSLFSLVCISAFTTFGSAVAQENPDSLFSQGVGFMNDAGDWSVKGNTGRANEYYQKAIDKFGAAIQINDRLQGLIAAMAHCYFETKQYTASVHWYEKAVAQDSSLAKALGELGISHIYLGEADTAVHYIRMAVRHDGNELFVKGLSVKMVEIADEIQGKANILRKKDLEPGNDLYRIAMKVLIEAFELDPYRNEVAKNISDLGFRLNDYDIASKYLQYSVR